MRDEPFALKMTQAKGRLQSRPSVTQGTNVRALICSSARRLAAAGDADLFPQAVDADRADHHLLADHVARRAVHAHRLRELEVFLDRGADFRARTVLLELRDIEAGVLGGGQRARLVGLALAGEELLGEVEILLA